MLVLSRKLQEELCISPDIIIKVISIGGGRVRLGITAPAHVRVLRREAVERRAAEQKTPPPPPPPAGSR